MLSRNPRYRIQHRLVNIGDFSSLSSVSLYPRVTGWYMMPHISPGFLLLAPLSLVSNYIFHASELCHSMGGFMVYSLFGIIQIIVKYFETFYTLFVQFYPSFHWKTVISPASIGNRISSTCKKFRESLKLTKSFLSIHFITLLKENCNKSFLDTFSDDKFLSVFRLVIIRRKCQ